MIRTFLAWLVVVPFAVWAVLRVTGADIADRWIQLVAFTPTWPPPRWCRCCWPAC
ncbi:hypothetical protein [Nonomuraea recticatena]|uniref:hypothetical protein n=1 Tax=Nonomuraea recticatena TaxID=46178 RepID=UPI00360E4080